MQNKTWGGKRTNAGRKTRKLFTRRAAALILDLAEAYATGTPHGAHYHSIADEKLRQKVDRIGLDKASEIAAEDYPDLV